MLTDETGAVLWQPRDAPAFVSVRPDHTSRVCRRDDDLVKSLRHVSRAGLCINGGSLAFRPGMLDEIQAGEQLTRAARRVLTARGGGS